MEINAYTRINPRAGQGFPKRELPADSRDTCIIVIELSHLLRGLVV